jgi:Tfp pilus assembly protein PilV
MDDSSANRRWRLPVDRGGFTIVETIVALVILTVGILAVATVSSTSIYQVRRSQDLTNSAMAAQRVMEQIMEANFDSVKVGKYMDTISITGIDYYVGWSVENAPDSMEGGGGELKTVMLLSGGGLTQTSAEQFDMMLYKPGGGP